MVLDGEHSSSSQLWNAHAQKVGVFEECLRDYTEGNKTSLRLRLGSKSLVVAKIWTHLYLVSFDDIRKSHIPNFIMFRNSHPWGPCFTDFHTWSKTECLSSFLPPTVVFLFLKSKFLRHWTVPNCFGWQENAYWSITDLAIPNFLLLQDVQGGQQHLAFDTFVGTAPETPGMVRFLAKPCSNWNLTSENIKVPSVVFILI